jgi:hypothetical protein
MSAGYAKLKGNNCQAQHMNTCKRHRFPPGIISYAVWLYYRFNLSHRDIEDLLAERGITLSRESFRLRCIKFGAVGSGISIGLPGGTENRVYRQATDPPAIAAVSLVRQ